MTGVWLLAAALLLPDAAGVVPIYRAPPGEERHDVPNCFIVQLQQDATNGQEIQLMSETPGDGPNRVWNNTFRGFMRCNVDHAELQNLANHPDVASINEDAQVQVFTTQRTSDQYWNIWNLDRLDQRNLPLSDTYSYTLTGDGVNVYVIDSGIDPTLEEFGGRILPGVDFVGDGRGTYDCFGHGTFVSGIVMSNTYGVAKTAVVTPVRVVDCNGNSTLSDIIDGITWAVKDYQSQPVKRPAVINLSLGGYYNPGLNSAVAGAVSAGLTAVVAAGNDNTDANNTSPASEPSALTIGATDITDTRAYFSNYGPLIDLFAPGVDILSTYPAPDMLALWAGTSFSTAHVTGAVAIYLQANPLALPAEIASWVTTSATKGVLSDVQGSTNSLLYLDPSFGAAAGSVDPPVQQEPADPAGGSCANPLFQNFTSAGSAQFQDVCLPLATDTFCSLPNVTNSQLWVQVDLPRTRRSQWWWVGAKACGAECNTCTTPPCAGTCGCQAVVSMYEGCAAWLHSRPQCGGIITQQTSITLGLAVRPTAGLTPTTCCFNFSVSIAPWTETCSPPQPCCS